MKHTWDAVDYIAAVAISAITIMATGIMVLVLRLYWNGCL